jgi:uncharacterized tellurite resistance protein B-like protein
VERDLELMEPSYLEEKTAQADLMRRVRFLSGMVVAAANGEVHESETRALAALLGVDAMWSPPPVDKIKDELAQKLAQAKAETSRLARTQLVQHLTIIAAADGSVEESELAAMLEIAMTLDVPADIIDETLHASASPMD